MVGSVSDSLNPAVRKRNSVRATNNTIGITRLSGVEVGLGVVIGDTIGERVWLRGLLGIFHRSVVDRCRGMVDNWGRGVVGSRSSMDNSMVAMTDAVAVSNAMSNVGHMRHCGGAGHH